MAVTLQALAAGEPSTGQWHQNSSPVASRHTTIANTPEDLFGEEATARQGGTILGGYLSAQGIVAIAVARHGDDLSLEQTLRHEVLGHFSLNTFGSHETR